MKHSPDATWMLIIAVLLLGFCAWGIMRYEPSKSVQLTDKFLHASAQCDESSPMTIGKAQYAGTLFIEVTCKVKPL